MLELNYFFPQVALTLDAESTSRFVQQVSIQGL
jgi:hypothetical protein